MGSQVWERLRVLRREHGQDIVEYTMLIAFIAIVAVVAVSALGNLINETFYTRFANQFLNIIG